MLLTRLTSLSFILRGLLILIFASQTLYAAPIERGVVTEIPPSIYDIFPTATRIATKITVPNVTAVFQLNELIGYVFESDDFTNIIGFSGQSINLLIGIDPQGVLIRIKVLNHHEPIFLHGLGEQPMITFIEQFEGHSIKERFIIDARDTSNNLVSHIDGVTKATVSALVINDTIISSALGVARTMLDGFQPPSQHMLKPNHFVKYNFDQLVAGGYITHWQQQSLALISQFDFLKSRLEQFAHGGRLVDLYIAPLSVPMVGKNLLSHDEYQRLLDDIGPGNRALLIIDNGDYPFVNESFIAQTSPERFNVVQVGLPQDIRDIDFYSFLEPTFITTVPPYQRLMVLAIKGKSGFDLASEFEYQLGIDYNISFMSRHRHVLSQQVTLPSDLFIRNTVNVEDSEQLWRLIWRTRLTEIVLLCVYLTIVLMMFKYPDRVSKLFIVPIGQRILRVSSLSFCILFIGFYAQGQLSVVNVYTLLLSISMGFNLTVFLLDPMLFILWAFVFCCLFIWGRGVFCGWLCPFGALQEMLALIATKYRIKQWRVPVAIDRRSRWLKYLILVSLVASAFYQLALAEQLAEIEPFKTTITMNFARYWPFVIYSVVLLMLSIKIHKFYCRYLCPLGAGLAIIGAFPMVKWIRRRPECGNGCQLCQTKKCGVGAINDHGQINYQECIGCFECVVTINQPTICVVDKYSKKNQ